MYPYAYVANVEANQLPKHFPSADTLEGGMVLAVHSTLSHSLQKEAS